jgi:hypothetical protein
MSIDRLLDRTGRKFSARAATLAAFLIVTGPQVAAAQQSPLTGETVYPPGEPSSSLELTGYVGALTPLADLASSGDSISLEFSTKLAFSAGLDLWFPSGLGLGVLGGYSRPDMTVQLALPPLAEGLPTRTEELDLGAADYWYAVGTLMYRPNLGGPAALVRPYFLAGGGVLHTGEGSGTVNVDEGPIVISVESATKPVGVLGFGGHVLLGNSWFLRLEIRDYISSFDSEPFSNGKLQNDLVSSFGVGLAL